MWPWSAAVLVNRLNSWKEHVTDEFFIENDGSPSISISFHPFSRWIAGTQTFFCLRRAVVHTCIMHNSSSSLLLLHIHHWGDELTKSPASVAWLTIAVQSTPPLLVHTRRFGQRTTNAGGAPTGVSFVTQLAGPFDETTTRPTGITR